MIIGRRVVRKSAYQGEHWREKNHSFGCTARASDVAIDTDETYFNESFCFGFCFFTLARIS